MNKDIWKELTKGGITLSSVALQEQEALLENDSYLMFSVCPVGPISSSQKARRTVLCVFNAWPWRHSRLKDGPAVSISRDE